MYVSNNLLKIHKDIERWELFDGGQVTEENRDRVIDMVYMYARLRTEFWFPASDEEILLDSACHDRYTSYLEELEDLIHVGDYLDVDNIVDDILRRIYLLQKEVRESGVVVDE